MEKIIYKFLDEYCGNDKFKSSKTSDNAYHIFSSKNVLVLRFYTNGKDKFTMFKSSKLCKTVESFFSLDEDSATNHIKLWFGDRAGLNKVGDLKKFL
jgi:hypothetical protein